MRTKEMYLPIFKQIARFRAQSPINLIARFRAQLPINLIQGQTAKNQRLEAVSKQFC